MPRIVGKGELQRVSEPPRFRRHTDGELRATLMGRLVTVSELLRNTASVESAAAAIGRAALMLTGASRGAIFLRLPNGVVTCPWFHNLSDEYIGRLCTPADANPWAHLSHYPELACMDLSARGRARSVAPSIVEDVRTLPGGNEMRRAAEREGLRSLFSWPVGRKGRVFAAITYYFDVPHTCTDPEREVALAFTLQAGATLEQVMVVEKRPHAPARGGFFGGIVFGKRHIDRVAEPRVEPPAAAGADEHFPPRAPETKAAEPEPPAPAAALEAGTDNDADSDGDVEAEGDTETEAGRIAALQRALETEAGRLWSERTHLGVEREQTAVARRELNTERERLAEMRRVLDADQGRLTEMHNTITAESARNTKVRGELEAEQARMSALRQGLEAERTQVEGARRAIEAERDKAAALRRDTDAALALLAETRRVIDAEMAKLAAARGELEAERGRLATLQAEVRAREAQLEEVRRDLDAEHAGAAAELERQRSELLNARGNFTAAQAEVAQQRTALEEESARLAQARRDVDADRDRLAALVRSLEVDGPRVADVAAEAAAAGPETDTPSAPPGEVGTQGPHPEVGMVPSESAPSTVQAVAPWTPAEAARPVEMSKAAGPAQPSIPVQTKPSSAKPAAAKAAPAVKPAPVVKPVSKPAPSKPGPAPKPAKHAASEPQPVPAPVDPATAQKYRERIAQWALAAARALASKEQDAADLQAAAMLYEVETGDGAAPTPGVAEILSNVQEQWNGKGGPQGLSGQDIPLGARILAVTVAYAEMVIGRPGSPMLYYLDAKAALKRNAGSKYDPEIVKAFCRVVNRA